MGSLFSAIWFSVGIGIALWALILEVVDCATGQC